jgi:hypothetical protein
MSNIHLLSESISVEEMAFAEYGKVHQKIKNLRAVGLGVSDELTAQEKRCLDEYRASSVHSNDYCSQMSLQFFYLGLLYYMYLVEWLHKRSALQVGQFERIY